MYCTCCYNHDVMQAYAILVCVIRMMLFIDYIVMMRMTYSGASGFMLFVWSNGMTSP